MEDYRIIYLIIATILIITFFIHSHKKGKLCDDCNSYHTTGLILFIVSSIVLWAGLIWMDNSNVNLTSEKNMYSLYFSVMIGVFTWARIAYTFGD
jgi:hypothetical protein